MNQRRSSNRKIVVGVDGSDDGLRAVDYAVAEARLRDTALHIVTAVDTTGVFGSPIPAKARTAIVAAGQGTAKAALRQAAASGFPRQRLSTETPVGKPGPVLAEQSTTAEAIVLGRRDLGGLERVFAGSTSAAVAAAAQCPTLIVPHRWHPPMHPLQTIGVGIDGTPRSLAALETAFEEAATRGSELVVAYAWEPPMANFAGVSDYLDALAIWGEAAELEMAETLAGWQAEYPDVRVTRRFLRAHPPTALVDLSSRLDLLFLGVGGQDGRRHPHLGAVARAVVAGSNCPIALVRDARPEPRETEEDEDARRGPVELLRRS